MSYYYTSHNSYEYVYGIRPGKTVGCCLFITENISYTLRKDLTSVESVFIEVEKCTVKKVILKHYIGYYIYMS